jgi:hypothetical protein
MLNVSKARVVGMIVFQVAWFIFALWYLLNGWTSENPINEYFGQFVSDTNFFKCVILGNTLNYGLSVLIVMGLPQILLLPKTAFGIDCLPYNIVVLVILAIFCFVAAYAMCGGFNGDFKINEESPIWSFICNAFEYIICLIIALYVSMPTISGALAVDPDDPDYLLSLLKVLLMVMGIVFAFCFMLGFYSWLMLAHPIIAFIVIIASILALFGGSGYSVVYCVTFVIG